jgi:hypothetical protein
MPILSSKSPFKSFTASRIFSAAAIARSGVGNFAITAVQKSRNYILLIEFMLGGKSYGVDTAKLAVWPVLHELFDRAYLLRLRRLSQNSEEVFGFAGEFHGTIRVIALSRRVEVLGDC